MLARIRRRLFVWRTLRRIDKQVKGLMQEQARGQTLAKTVRIRGPDWEGTLNPRTGSVNVRILGRVEKIDLKTHIEQEPEP